MVDEARVQRSLRHLVDTIGFPRPEVSRRYCWHTCTKSRMGASSVSRTTDALTLKY